MRMTTDASQFSKGRYQDLVVLKRGHYGTVYDAFDSRSRDRVALKVLTLTGSHREVAEEMVQREVGALEGLQHPAIVRLLGHFEEREQNHLGIVLELIPGGTNLENLIQEVRSNKRPRFELRWCAQQLSALLDGLDKAHQRNVIHRDVKPANILYHCDEERLKLADFGVALLLENFGRADTGRTLREFYTRPFAAPEQVLRTTNATVATDLHAFGLLCASLLTWQLPPDDFQPQQLTAFLAPLREQVSDPALFKKVSDVLQRLLLPQPEQRPRSSDVLLVLQELIERTTQRTTIRVVLTHNIKGKLPRLGFKNATDFLQDLGTDLRVRYEDEQIQSGVTSKAKVRLWGRTLWSFVKESEDGTGHLVLIDAGRNPPDRHERERENETQAPFRLAEGREDGQALVSFAYEAYVARRQQKEALAQQDSLFNYSKRVLEIERDRLARILIRYELQSEKSVRSGGGGKLGTLGDKLQAAGMLKEPPPSVSATPDSYETKAGEFLRFRVHGASIPIGDTGQTTELNQSWYLELNQESRFYIGKREIGAFHAYDDLNDVLTVRSTSASTLKGRAVLELVDKGTETSLDRQESALTILGTEETVNPRLRSLILFPEENRLGEIRPRALLQDLKPAERYRGLVERAIASEDFFFLQGPPGTGKTTFIAEVAGQLIQDSPRVRILITSQANEAVNHALGDLRKLAEKHGPRWRIVRFCGDKQDNEPGGFNHAFREWSEAVVKKSVEALGEVEQSGGPFEIEQVRAAVETYWDRLKTLPDARQDFAGTVNVFGVTCLKVPKLGRELLRELTFEWVIVDEAAKATPTEVLVSLIVGKHFILVGDHKQLPPYLDSQTEAQLKVEQLDVKRAKTSLFEELRAKVPEGNRDTLRTQFRMHRSIGTFVSELYYADDGGLETGVPDEQRTLELKDFNRNHRVFWVDVNGQERNVDDSFWNREEGDVIESLLLRFDAELSRRADGLSYSCGVIAAYAEQRSRLVTRIVPSSTKWKRLAEMQVSTVDAFQGKQKDIIIYSMVRTSEGEKPFISDRRRLNVAFSRARRLLIIIGSKQSAVQSTQLVKVIEKIPEQNILSMSFLGLTGGRR